MRNSAVRVLVALILLVALGTSSIGVAGAAHSVPAQAGLVASASYGYDNASHAYDSVVVGRVVHPSLHAGAANPDGIARPSLPQAGATHYDPFAEQVAPNSTRFFAGNGPLDEGVAATFRSGTYDEVVLSQDTLLYRVYGGEAGPIGGYWSRTPPTGPMQAQMDLALNPEWGNLATDVATIRVPAGATIYEGAAAAQSLPAGGTLLGGGNQVFIPNVNPGWLVGG